MSVEIGDAVLRFLGDSQQLDAKFDEVGPNAEKAFQPAAEAAEDAGERMGTSMREARGEVRLLGEEVGIRLPRHVGNFLAELPGVGPAMSAAFSATAVLFLIQALVEGTNKLTDWISNTYIFTQAMKDINSSVGESNKLFALQAAAISEAKEALSDFGLDKIELARKKIDELRDTMNKESQAAAAAKNIMHGYVEVFGEAAEKQADFQKAATENIRATNAANEADLKRQLLIKQLADTEHEAAMRTLDFQKKIALSYALSDQEKYELDQEYEQKKLALLNTYGEKDKAAIQELNTTIETQQIQHADKITAAFVKMLQVVGGAQSHAAEMVKDSVVGNTIALTPLEAALQKAENAAHEMNITMGVDLVNSLEKAKNAEMAFAASGIVDKTTMVALQKATADAQKALDNYGHSVDTFKVKSKGMWAEFKKEAEDGAKAMDLVKQSGVQAFDDISRNIQSAFASIVLGQGNVVQALEKATAASLAQIASQAAVKAIFYTAEGVAAAVTPGLQGQAAGYFTAAGEMAGIAAVAGVAGHELAGAGGSSSTNTQQSANTNSNTGQSNRSGGSVVGVQAFAEGGLISGPTLALMGEEYKREAVLPLDDPRAMEAIRNGVGSGTTNHFHIAGLVSADHIQQLVGKINKMVGRGQVNLTASNSLRLTKRSS
jgi:hypothetical protein